MLCHVQLSVYDDRAVVELREPQDRGWCRVSIVKCDPALFDAFGWHPWVDDVEVFTEFVEELTLEDIPVTVTQRASELLGEGVEALDIVRVHLQEDLVVGIECLNKSVIIDVVEVARLSINPALFHPGVSFSSWVGGSEEIRDYAFF